MKLQVKTLIVISTVVIVVIGFISLVFNYQNRANREMQMSNSAMDMSYTVANIPQISELLYLKKTDGSIQELIMPLMKETRYQYIIVMDMDGIQYSYPYTSGLYKAYKNGGEEQVLQEGIANVSTDTNELISAVRSFHPIYYKGEQVGAVLVGLLTTQIIEENATHLRAMELALLFGAFAGIIAAYFFSVDVKKSIFGLEPKEIAMLLTQKDLIFQNIERGIVSVDNKGKILLCNKKAMTLLNIEDQEYENLQDISPEIYEIARSVMEKGENHFYSTCTLKMHRKVMVSVCLMKSASGEFLGVVMSLEDLTQVRALAEELTDYRSLVDSLRAQNHEFMNKLQTISGLIQLDKYEDALDYIQVQSLRNKGIEHLLSEKIRDNKIAGLLLAKFEYLSEKRIEFDIDDESEVTALPSQLLSEDVCTIVGNIINNSVDALGNLDDRLISLYIYANEDYLELQISNTGPYLELSEEDVFAKGKSSKGINRGLGLYLVKEIVDKAKGTICWKNDEEVTWYVRIKDNQNTNS